MSQFDRRQVLRLTASLGAVGSLAPILSGCTGKNAAAHSGKDKSSKINIGLIAPQGGSNRDLGLEIINAFEMYLKDRANCLGHHRINLITEDEGQTPGSAKAAIERLLKQRVHAFVGVSHADALSEVRDSIESARIPLVTPSPSLPSIQGAKYIWRTGYVTDEPGIALGKWIAEHVRGPVFVMAGNSTGIKEDVRGFVNALKAAGGSIFGEPAYCLPGTKAFTTSLSSLKSPSMGALFCLYSGTAAVDAVKQLRAAGLPQFLQIYAPGYLTEGPQLALHGGAANGIYTSMNYSTDLATDDNRRFVSNYQKQYSVNPSAFAVAAYDAAIVLDQALMTTGNDASALDINNSIAKLGQIESPRGLWQFNQNRSPLQKWFLRQVRADGPILANVLAAELITLG